MIGSRTDNVNFTRDERWKPWLAWTILLLSWLLALASFPLAIRLVSDAFQPGTLLYEVFPLTYETPLLEFLGWHLDILLPPLLYVTLGAFIVLRQPKNRIGWLFCAIGFLGAVTNITGYYAFYALAISQEQLPGGLVSGWVSSWIWVIQLGLLFIYLPLLFPNGTLLSSRWRWVGWLAAWGIGMLVLIIAIQPGYLLGAIRSLTIENPFAIEWMAAESNSHTPLESWFVRFISIASYAVLNSLLFTLILAVLSLVLRFRRAKGEERQQIKWFAYFAVLLVLTFVFREVVRNLLGRHEPAFEILITIPWLIVSLGLPISAGMAVLKYRLYNIDILIRRTLVYSILTAILALVYFASVIALQSSFRLLTGQAGQAPAAVVLSTLGIAALFSPLRRRIQSIIDRRFYRSKVDAEKTLAEFSAMLREEVDLETIAGNLMTAVEKTMQPESVTLWLREPEPPRSPSLGRKAQE